MRPIPSKVTNFKTINYHQGMNNSSYYKTYPFPHPACSPPTSWPHPQTPTLSSAPTRPTPRHSGPGVSGRPPDRTPPIPKRTHNRPMRRSQCEKRKKGGYRTCSRGKWRRNLTSRKYLPLESYLGVAPANGRETQSLAQDCIVEKTNCRREEEDHQD